jgi:hypothetical protein
MRFSQRIGKTAVTKDFQLESIDTDLKNSLWNIIKLWVLDSLPKASHYGEAEFQTFCKVTWHKLYKLPVDTIPRYDYERVQAIRNKFFDGEWYEVYDLIEFITENFKNNINVPEFINQVNVVLENEFAGYRFIGGRIAPISNDIEISEVNTAVNQVKHFSALIGANIHLSHAIDRLSDKRSPDYRTSIKESISAVETACRVLTNESTLGKALNALESKGITINEQLKNGFEKIYAFTNDKQSGIRHAIIEEHKSPDFDDAKYMLVACSSFINYLVGKCKSIGINLDK